MGISQILQETWDSDSSRLKFGVVVAGGSLICLGKWMSVYVKRRNDDKKRAVLRQARDNMVSSLQREVDKQSTFLQSEKASAIKQMSFMEIVNKLQQGDVACVDVLHVYQAAALEVHEKHNCLTSVVGEAGESALQLDKSKTRKGLLHGIPISIKDSIAMAGYSDSRGLASLATFIHDDDSVLVKVLKKQGAVPFVRTTVPQLLMSYETCCLTYGVTSNPHDVTRNCGGSSGGEGALIGAGGSLLGFGTDIGGSVRAPSAFSGCCGLKPTVGRLSNRGPKPPGGQNLVLSTAGPMGCDVDSLVLAMKAVLVDDMFSLDPLVPPLPFNNSVFESSKPLTIGYYIDNEFCPASPANVRAVLEAKAVLEKAGHKLVPWTPPDTNEAVRLVFRSLGGDGGKYFKNLILGEEVTDTMKPLISWMTMRPFIRYFSYLYNKYVKRDKRTSWMVELFKGTSSQSVTDWWTFFTEISAYKEKFSSNWRRNELDAVLSPSFAFPALKIGSSKQNYLGGSYLLMYNVVDYPAGVLPVTSVTDDDIQELKNWGDDDPLFEYVRDDQQSSLGLPVGVQVIASRWNEETCLRVMKDIENGVKKQ